MTISATANAKSKGAAWNIGQNLEIGPQTDKGEAALEDENKPDAETRNRAHQWPHCPIHIQVCSTGLGHCRCHLRAAEDGWYDNKPRRAGRRGLPQVPQS